LSLQSPHFIYQLYFAIEAAATQTYIQQKKEDIALLVKTQT